MARRDEATELAKRLVAEVERDAAIVGPRLFDGGDDEMARVTRAGLLDHVRAMWGEPAFRSWLRQSFGEEAFVAIAEQAGVGYEAPRAIPPLPGVEPPPSLVEPLQTAPVPPIPMAPAMGGAGSVPMAEPVPLTQPEDGVEMAHLRRELADVKALLLQVLAQGMAAAQGTPVATLGTQNSPTPAFAPGPALETLDGPYPLGEAL